MPTRRFLLLVLIVILIVAPIVVAFGFKGCTTQSEQSVAQLVLSETKEIELIALEIPTPTITPTSIITTKPTITILPTPTKDPYEDMPKYNIELDKKIQQYLWDKCKEHKWNYDLILSQLKLESDLDPNCKSHNKNGTTDCGLAQINNAPGNMEWYGEELAGIENFDPFNPYHSIDACIAGMNFYRTYWQKQGIEGETLIRYSLNSYNMGINGFKKYVNNTGTSSRGYDRVIAKYECQLKEKGKFVE